MQSRPLIGIAPQLIKPSRNRDFFVGTYRNYVSALERAGADVAILSPRIGLLKRYVKLLDGVLLTGGGDIHPRHFRRKAGKVKLRLSPEERTLFELNLVRTFVRAERPVLGICLGCQTINVALGGDLHLDLAAEIPQSKSHRQRKHLVSVAPTTRLHRIVGTDQIRVNSYHHQAPRRLGKGLIVAGTATDSVIEAIEGTSGPFLLGVQWHPEELPSHGESQKLFKAFVDACRG